MSPCINFIGARALWGPDYNAGPVVIHEINCDSSKTALLDCNYYRHYCRYGGGASVRCRDEQLRVQNVSVAMLILQHTLS